ncbi:hypothetical protein DHU18_13945 [Salmonella enterica]|uniref:Phage integrase family protein n=1 Tax=Salmonella enterica TaxID=28901 RepID=A0A5Y7WAH8_SALER|nr:hypothetical protein [Salmonella enterica]ECQ3013422.1 phage integrase family protein [Salmonella enterica]
MIKVLIKESDLLFLQVMSYFISDFFWQRFRSNAEFISEYNTEKVEAAAADGVTFSVPVTPHTFRHSYAMHMLYAGIPLKVLQSLMGHKSISSTEVYTRVFALDVAARHRVQFQMPGTEAVAMLKGRG